MLKFFNHCCNPLNLKKHIKKSSRHCLPKYLIIHFGLSTSDRVYSACHKKLLRKYAETSPNNTDNKSKNISN